MGRPARRRFLGAVASAREAVEAGQSAGIAAAFEVVRSAGDALLRASPTVRTRRLIAERAGELLASGDRHYGRGTERPSDHIH